MTTRDLRQATFRDVGMPSFRPALSQQGEQVMNEDMYRELAAYLVEVCTVQNVAEHQAGCNEDFTHTERWLQAKRFSADQVQEALDWLQRRGIDCDCEVLWSALPQALGSR